MGKKSTPEPPDLGPQAAASEEIARMQQQTAAEQLAWAREQDTANRQVLQQVLDVQLPIMQQQFDNAQQDRARYEGTFQPLENNLINEFQSYDSPERRDIERGRAIADVSSSFDAARRNALQRLEGYGVDPSQTRNSALDLGVRVQQAAAQAAAGTAADQRVTDTARALRADAINIGKGLPSQVAQSYGQSLQAGQAGIGGANSTTSTSAGALTSGLGFSGQALQGMGQSANIQSQGFGNQMQAYNAQQQANGSLLSGLGSAAGMAMMLADGGPRRAIPRRADEMHPMHEAREGEGMVDEGRSDGSGVDDQVPAMISVGEYVVPADVVRTKGREFFDRLVDKYHTPARQQRQEMRRALPVGA